MQLYIKSRAKIEGPRFASLFITRKCNLTCPYCDSIKHDFKDLNTEEWKRVIDKLYSWGVRVFSLTGGEPTVRGDIEEIVSYISKEKKAICWMISNFRTMKESKIDKLADAGLDALTCSLDSLKEIGVKSDGKVLELLKYARKRNILPFTLTVVTKNNIDEIKEIYRRVTSEGIIFDMGLFQNVGGIFSPSDDSLKVKDAEKLKDLRYFLRKEKLFWGRVAPSMSYLREDNHRYFNSCWKCPSEEDKYLVINNDGRMMTCQEFLEDVSILDMESLEDLRWRQSKKKTVEDCKGCFYGCYYQKVESNTLDEALGVYAILRA